MKKQKNLLAVTISMAILAISNVQTFANNDFYCTANDNQEVVSGYADIAFATPAMVPLMPEPDANGCYLCATACPSTCTSGTCTGDGASPCYYTGNDEVAAKCCFDVTALYVVDYGITKQPCAVTNNGEGTFTLRGIPPFTFTSNSGATLAPTETVTASSLTDWAYTYKVTGIPYNATSIVVKAASYTTSSYTITSPATMTPYAAVTISSTNPAQTVCSGASITPMVISGGGPVGGSWAYSWTAATSTNVKGPGSGSNGTVTGAFVNTTAATQTINITRSATFTSSDGAVCPASSVTTLTVRAPFTTGSITNASYASCNNTSGTVSSEVAPASGGEAPYTYRWVVSGASAATLSTNTATITPTATTVPGTYYYTRQVKDVSCNTAWTNSGGSVTWIVYPAVSQSANTFSTAICSGGSATINMNAATGGDGSNYTYLWKHSTDGGSNWFDAPIPNAGVNYTTPVLTNTTSSKVTNYYRRIASSCNTSATSTPATVTIHPQFTAGTISSTSQTFCSGGTPGIVGNITDASGGDGTIYYSWYKNNSASSITGATNKTYTPPVSDGIAAVTTSITYTRKATDGGTCNGTLVQSANQWVLTVNKLPSTPIPPSAGTVLTCGTGTVSLSATGASAGESYEWYDAGQGKVAAGNPYITPVLAAPSTNTFYVAITNGSCTSTLVPIQIIVKASDLSAPVAVDAKRCGSGVLTISVDRAPKPTEVYTWYTEDGGTQLGTGSSYTTPSLSVSTNYRLAVSSTEAGGCSVTPALGVLVKAIVNDIPIAPAVSLAARCAAGTVSIPVTSNAGTNEVFKWYNSSSGGSSIYTGGTYQPDISNSQTYYVETANTVTGCTSTRTATTATVNPLLEPAGVQNPLVFSCGTGTASVVATGASAGEGYRWYANASDDTPAQEGTRADFPITFNTAPSTAVAYAEKYNTITGCPSTSRTPATATAIDVTSFVQPIANSNSRCGTGTVDLSVTGTPAVDFEYIWYDAGGATLTKGSSYTTTTISTSTTYYVGTANTASRCETPQTARVTVVATVHSVPSVPVVQNVARCEAGIVSIVATSGAGINEMYRWYTVPTGGSSITTDIVGAKGESYTPTISSASTYYVETVNTVTGCVSARTAVTAYVNASPGIPTVTRPANICQGSSLAFSASGGSTPYDWINTGGDPVGATKNSYQFTATTAGTYNVYVRSSQSYVNVGVAVNTVCYSNTVTASAEVFARPADPTTITVSPASAVICQGGTMSFEAVVSQGVADWSQTSAIQGGVASGNTYSFSGGAISGGIKQVTARSVQTYNNGLGGTFTCYSLSSATASGNVISVPDRPIFEGGNTPVDVCSSSSPVVGLAIDNSKAGLTYQWYRDNALVSTGVSSTYDVTQTGTYSVIAVTGACSSTRSSNKFVRIETRTPGIPSIDGAGSITSACGGPVQLTADQIVDATGYQWFIDGSVIPGANLVTYSTSQSGQHSYTVRALINQCQGAMSSQPKVVNITTSTVAVPVITTPSNDVLNFISQCDGVVTLTSGTVSGAQSYQWYKNDNAIAGETSMSLTVSESGEYVIRAVDGECKSDKKADNTRNVLIAATPGQPALAAAITECQGTPVTLDIVAPVNNTNATTIYQWYQNGVAIGSASTITSYTPTASGSYTVSAINNALSKSCRSNASNVQEVLFIPPVNIMATPELQTAYSGRAIRNIILSPAATFTAPAGGQMEYAWTMDKPAGLNTTVVSSGNGTPIAGTFTYANVNDQTSSYTTSFTINAAYVLNGKTCAMQTPVTATVVVRAAASDYAEPSVQSICSNSSATITLKTTDPGTLKHYDWTRSVLPQGVTCSSPASATGYRGDPVIAAYTNTTHQPQTVSFVFVPYHEFSPGVVEPQDAFTATVTVLPVVSGSVTTGLSSQTVCSGEPITSITFDSPLDPLGGALSYTWTMGDYTGLTTTIPSSGTGTISGDFTNTIQTPKTVEFSVTPHYQVGTITCSGASFSASVTVQPVAVVTPLLNTAGVACANTSLVLSAASATPNATFEWSFAGANGVSMSPGSGTSLPANLLFSNSNAVQSTGTITVTPKYATCIGIPSAITATVNPSMTINQAGITHVQCYGAANGSVGMAATGGIGALSYTLLQGSIVVRPVQASATFTNLAAGSYMATAIDQSGCGVSLPVTINGPAQPLGGNITHIRNICSGNTGSVTVSATNGTGTAPYDYHLSDNMGIVIASNTSGEFTGLSVGSYTVNISDANGCTLPAPLSFSIGGQSTQGVAMIMKLQDVTCNGATTGQLGVMTMGANFASYSLTRNGVLYQSYNIASLTNSNVIPGLPAGTYKLSAADVQGCSVDAPAPVEITEPSMVSHSYSNIVAQSACNIIDGKATIQVAGGNTPPYKFELLNGLVIPNLGVSTNVPYTLTGLNAGESIVYIVDSKGCRTETSVQIPTAASNNMRAGVKAGSVKNVTCNGGGNGSFEIEVTGGQTPYTRNYYTYSADGTNWSAPMLYSSFVFNNAPAGIYKVSLSDNAACNAIVEAVISQPTSGVRISSTQTNVTCYGAQNGSASVFMSGGQLPYSYTWSNGKTTSFISDLAPGTYSVMVSDAGTCTSTLQYVITGPTAELRLDATSGNVNAGCNGKAKVDLQVTGGSAPYSFAINGQPVAKSNYAVNGNNVELYNVSPGTYMVSVTDANTCTSPSAQVAITVNNAPNTLNLSNPVVTGGAVACATGNNAAIEVTVTGGEAYANGSYEFQLNDNYPVRVTPNASNKFVLVGLGAGSYVVTVRDAAGCQDQLQSIVTVPAATENKLGITVATTQSLDCYQSTPIGAMNIAVTGGTTPYSATYTLQPSGEAKVVTFGAASSVTISGLQAGYYAVKVKDANGCLMQSANEGHVTQPDPVTFTVDYTTATCPGSADATIVVTNVAGGHPASGYEYSKDGVNYVAAGTFTNLTATIHRIYVRDKSTFKCAGYADVTIPAVAPMTITTDVTSPTKGNSDGAIAVTVTGGTAPYTYSKDRNYFQTGNTFNNIPAGEYYVAAKDHNGCTATANAAIIVAPATGGSLTVVPSVTSVACANSSSGIVDLTVFGGSGNYLFSMDAENPNSWKQEPQFAGLQAGVYTIYVKDDAGHTASVSATIENALPIQVTAAYKANLGNGLPGIEVTAAGGTGVLQYSLNGQNWQTQQMFVQPASGDNIVYVKDANGCENSAITVVVPDLSAQKIGFTVEVTGAANCDYSQKLINVTGINGGTGAYQYSINGGNSWAAVSGTSFTHNAAAGTYKLKIKDDSGNESAVHTSIVTIESSSSISLNVAATAACHGVENGIIMASATGGIGILQYSIDGANYNNLGTFSGLSARSYSVSVRDDKGCVVTKQAVVNSAAPVVVKVTSVTNATNKVSTDGATVITATGGNGDFQYSQYETVNYQTTGQFANLLSSGYTFYAKDGNGCLGSVALSIGYNEPAPGSISLSANVTKDISCYASADGEVTLKAFTAHAVKYSKDYSTWADSPVFSGLSAGNYVFFVRDQVTGAEGSVKISIAEPAPLIVVPVLTTPLTTATASNAEVTVTAAGGTGNLTYARDGGSFGTSNVFGQLSHASYTFTAKDAKGCTGNGYIIVGTPGDNTIVPPTPATLTITATLVQPLTCSQPAKVLVTANGAATDNYRFVLNGVSHNGAKDYIFDINTAGSYNLSISASTLTSKTLSITVAPAATGDFDLTATGATTTICYGENDASITLQTTGGNATNRWYRLQGEEWGTARVFNNLAAGNYVFEAKDEKGCVVMAQTIITAPASKLKVSASIVSGLPNAAVKVTATGGVTPYEYSNDGTTFGTNATFTYTQKGTYTLYAKDKGGCVVTTQVVITDGLSVGVIDITPVSYYGGNDGAVKLGVGGGVEPYYVSKNGVDWFPADQALSGLMAGEQTFFVKDANGTVSTITVDIPQPEKMVVTTTVVATGDDGKSTVRVDVTGGTPGYYYSSDGTVFTNNPLLTGLEPGLQTIYVRDRDNTGQLIAVTVNVPASADDIMVSAFVSKDITCEGLADAEVTILASSGIPAYQYSKTGEDGTWTASNVLSGFTPGAHNVYVRDANGRTAYTVVTVKAPTPLRITAYAQTPSSAGATNNVTINVVQGIAPFRYSKFSNSGWQDANMLSGFGTGAFTVYAVDAHNCPAVSATGHITYDAPNGLNASMSIWQQPTCYNNGNGIVNITASGGTATGGYRYSINGGAYNAFNNGNNHKLSNLAPGTYSIMVQRGTETIPAPLTAIITQPASLNLTATVVDATCHGYNNGQVSLNVTGGTGYKEYSINGAEWTTGSVFTNLNAGIRTAYVRDAQGCVASANVTVSEPVAVNFTARVAQANSGAADGQVAIENVSGGKSPYTYSKDGNAWATNTPLTGFAGGNFTVYVKDANNCAASRSGYMNSSNIPDDFSATADVTKALTCSNSSDAQITINTSATGVTYSKDGVTYVANNVLTGFSAGVHTVYAKLNNKVVAMTVEVTPVAPLTIESIAVIPQITVDNAMAAVNITATGGTTPLQYKLNNTSNTTNNVITPVAVGTYTATVTDKNACSVTAPVIVAGSTNTDGSSNISISANTTQALKCYGDSDAQISVTATGASGVYQYTIGNTWITDNGVHTFTGLKAGSYVVKVRDAQDFTKQASMTVVIAQPTSAAWTASATAINNAVCYGATTGQIRVTATASDDLLYSTNRQNWTSSSTLTGFAAGVYTVFVKDTKGCVKEATATVSQPAAQLTITRAEVTKVIDRTNGAEITIMATGGTPAYTYAVDGGTFNVNNTIANVQPAGAHTVTVKDANGCIVKSLVPVATAATSTDAITGLSAEVTTQPKCYGDATGVIAVTVKGGKAPYTYDNGIDKFVSNETTHTFSSLVAGVYPVTVTDAQGNTLTKPVDVVAPAQLTVSAWSSDAHLITAQAQGGTPQYSYSTDDSHFASLNVISNLPLGTYYVYAADANGCKARSQTSIEVIDTNKPADDNFSVKAEVTTEASCSNAGKATVTVTVMDGKGAFVYAKENNDAAYQASNVFAGLAPGNYTFYAKNTSGRVKQVTITVGTATPLTLSVNKITPVTVANAADGSIVLQAAGGRAPYQYAMNGGTWQGSFVFAGLVNASYNMAVRDANGCTATVAVVLGDANNLSPSVHAHGNVTCYGGNDGWAEVYVTGGDGNYQYSLDNYTWQDVRVLTGLSAGLHTLYIKDKEIPANYAQVMVDITQPSRLQLSAEVIAPVDPTGSNTAAVRLSAQGGTLDYHYADVYKVWDIRKEWTGLSAGYHTLYVQDANKCVVSTLVNIGDGPAAVSLSAAVTKPLNCFGTANAEVTLTATNGQPPYQYSKNGQTWVSSNVLTGFTAGIQAVYAKDANGAVITTTVNVEQPSQLSAVAVVTKAASAANAHDAEVKFMPTGGAAPYQFSTNGTTWQTADVLSDLGVGTYVFYVRDANQCAVTVSAVSVGVKPEVTPGTNISFTAYVNGAVNCYGQSTGEITVIARDGNGTFDVSLNNNWTNNVSMPKVYTGLAAGTYTVAVRSNGKTADAVKLVITQPAAMSATAAVKSQITCYGSNTGHVVITANGGTAPYLYSRMGYNASESNEITGLLAGTQVFYVQDAAGCQGTTTAQLTQPASRLAVTAAITKAVTVAGGNAEVTVTATGGTPGTIGYHYSKTGLTWKYGTAPNATALLAGYEAGQQRVYVRDANDCVAQASLYISDNSGSTSTIPALSLSAAVTRALSCYGQSDAQITLTARGGAPVYTYSKDGVSYSATAVLSGFPAGEYTVYAKDANGNIVHTSVLVPAVQPVTAYAVVTAPVNASGKNAIVTVIAEGGSGAYNYAITPSISRTGNVFSPVSAGTYIISLSDVNGCVAAPVYVSVSNDPNGVNLTASVTNPLSCADGATAAITAFATGGTSPYMFNRNGSEFRAGANKYVYTDLGTGNYALQAKDANAVLSNVLTVPVTIGATSALTINAVTAQLNSCYNVGDAMLTISATGGMPVLQYSIDGYNYQIGNTIAAQQLQVGTRYVYVKDALGCEKQGVAVIAATPQQLQLLVASLTPPATGQNNGIIVSEAAGGTPAYTYTIGGNSQANGTFASLAANTYTVMVTDAQHCTDAETVVLGESPDQLSVRLQTQAPKCYNSNTGSITALVLGGTMPYSYSVDGKNYQSLNIFSGLAAGSYTLYVKDAQATPATATIAVVLAQPAEFKVSASVIAAPSASGANDMKVLATATGGQAPYNYEMAGYFNTTGLFANLSGGSYIVIARDDNQCEATTTLWAGNSNNSPSISVEMLRQPLCADSQTGIVKVTVSGGEAPYRYSSDNIMWIESNVVSHLGAGQQTIYVKEANGRITAVPVVITAPAPLSLNIAAIKAASGSTVTDGELVLQAIGGTPLYSYGINDMNYQSLPEIKGLRANTYTANVIDANGCRAWLPVLVSDASAATATPPCKVSVWAEVVSEITCIGNANAIVKVHADMTAGSYSTNNVTWTTDNTLSGFGAGITTVYVKSETGCTAALPVTVKPPVAIQAAAFVTARLSAPAANDGELTLLAIGGAGSYTYAMNGGVFQSSPTFGGLKAGNYTFTVKDAKGCSITVESTMTAVDIVLSAAAIEVAEGEAPAYYTVRLSHEPTANVGLLNTIEVADMINATPATLDYTAVNWDTQQLMTVNAIDNDLTDATRSNRIVTAVANTTDTRYSGIERQVLVLVRDNDFKDCNAFKRSVNAFMLNGTPVETKSLIECVSASQSFQLGIQNSGGVNFEWTIASENGIRHMYEPQLTITQNGTYSVQVTDKYGCYAELDGFVVALSTPPTAPVFVNTPDMTRPATGKVQIYMVQAEQVVYSWGYPDDWKPAVINADTTKNTLPLLVGKQAGNICVTASDSLGLCPSAKTCMGVTVQPAQPNVAVYPTILTAGNNTVWVTPTGFNITGIMVVNKLGMTQNYNVQANMPIIDGSQGEVRILNITAGHYFIIFTGSNGETISKLIVKE